MKVFTVLGHFTKFSGTVVVGNGLSDCSLSAVVDLASVDTDDIARDENLRSDRFFNVDMFPTMEFRSTGIRAIADEYLMSGQLNLHGVLKPIDFLLRYEGMEEAGSQVARFTARGQLKRKDFKLRWDRSIEATGVVANIVKIRLDIVTVKASDV
jgi:polyisoprenoid-binding protein YceI